MLLVGRTIRSVGTRQQSRVFTAVIRLSVVNHHHPVHGRRRDVFCHITGTQRATAVELGKNFQYASSIWSFFVISLFKRALAAVYFAPSIHGGKKFGAVRCDHD